MIDKCDPEIATWSETGDNFVVKDLDKFAKVSNSWSRHRAEDQLLYFMYQSGNLKFGQDTSLHALICLALTP